MLVVQSPVLARRLWPRQGKPHRPLVVPGFSKLLCPVARAQDTRARRDADGLEPPSKRIEQFAAHRRLLTSSAGTMASPDLESCCRSTAHELLIASSLALNCRAPPSPPRQHLGIVSGRPNSASGLILSHIDDSFTALAVLWSKTFREDVCGHVDTFAVDETGVRLIPWSTVAGRQESRADYQIIQSSGAIELPMLQEVCSQGAPMAHLGHPPVT